VKAENNTKHRFGLMKMFEDKETFLVGSKNFPNLLSPQLISPPRYINMLVVSWWTAFPWVEC